MNRVLPLLVVALLACSSSTEPADPIEVWGTYSYQADGYRGGSFTLSPQGGTFELLLEPMGVTTGDVTHVTVDGASVRFRLTHPATYREHEGELSGRVLAGTWTLSVDPAPGRRGSGTFMAIRE